MSINSKLDLLENQVDKLIEITKASKDLIEGISAPNINKIYSTNDTFQVVATQTAGTGETITNAGLFDASTSGNLFAKGDFTGIALSTGDSIQFTFKVQFS